MSCLSQRFGTVAGAVAAVFLGGANAFAQSSIAYWSFNDVPTTTTSIDASVRAELADADGGFRPTSAFMSFTNLNFGDGPNSGAGVTAFLGTTTNSTLPGGTTLSSGNALAIEGYTGLSNNAQYLEFGVPTTGFENILVSFATRGTGSGFNSNQFQYTLNGTDYIDLDPRYDGTPITYFVKTYDFSSIPGLDDNANAAFRILFDGATSVTGNNRIDNLQINGFATVIPEAGTGALLALPLFALGVVALRRRK